MELRLLLHMLDTAPVCFGEELSLISKEQIQLRIWEAQATPQCFSNILYRFILVGREHVEGKSPYQKCLGPDCKQFPAGL